MQITKPQHRTLDNQNNLELESDIKIETGKEQFRSAVSEFQSNGIEQDGQQNIQPNATEGSNQIENKTETNEQIVKDNEPNRKIKIILYVFGGLAIVLLVATAIFLPLYFKDVALAREKYNPIFKKYLSERNIIYEGKQFQYRLDIFIPNQLKLQELQASNLTWVPGHNNFSHLTDEELSSLFFSKKMKYAQKESFNTSSKERVIQHLKSMLSGTIENPEYIFNDSVPLKFTMKNGRLLQEYDFSYQTGPVADQGSCGSCTMFTAAQLMTALHYNQQGVLTEYSAQDLVDCTYKRYLDYCVGKWPKQTCYYENSGCQGGYTIYNLNYIRQFGLASQFEYPYYGFQGQCQTRAQRTPLKFFIHRGNTCNFLEAHTRLGVTAIIIHASFNFAKFYKSGIYTGEYTVREKRCSFLRYGCYYVETFYNQCDQPPNHAVVAVGNGKGFIKGKNSWGEGWGMNGFFFIKKWSCRMCQDSIYVHK